MNKMRCNELQIIKDTNGQYLISCPKTGISIPINTELKDMCANCDKDTHGDLFDEERT